jgi:hypothetical protein
MASALHFDTETIICGYRRVRRFASDGTPFATWEKVMGRRLPDYMLDAVVFVYPSKQAADEGEESGATGFLIGVPSKGRPTKGHIYAVTNEHVIRHGRSVVRMNKLGGKTATFDLSGAWVPHPEGDDVAIAPLEDVTDAALASRVLHSDILMNPVEYKNMNVGIGDDVYMVGRFLGHEHRDVNKPVVQQGHIATAITELTNPETNHKQTSILVELRSMSGYSGSVVVFRPAWENIGNQLFPFADQIVCENYSGRRRERDGFLRQHAQRNGGYCASVENSRYVGHGSVQASERRRGQAHDEQIRAHEASPRRCRRQAETEESRRCDSANQPSQIFSESNESYAEDGLIYFSFRRGSSEATQRDTVANLIITSANEPA